MKIQVIKYCRIEEILHDISPEGSIGKYLDQYVCRGIGSEEYELVPSACRSNGRELLQKIIGKEINIGKEVKNLQKHILQEIISICKFYDIANFYGLSLPENIYEFYNSRDIKPLVIHTNILGNRWIDDRYISIFALAQHYGLPTRLLDWSYDIYIALYFAALNCIRNNKNTECNNFVVWLLNKQLMQPPNAKEQLMFSTPVYNKNPNLLAQAGTFTTISQIVDESDIDYSYMPLDKYIGEFNNFFSLFNELPYMKKLIFPGIFAEPLMKILHKMRYSASRIFPGYSSIVQTLKERVNIF